VQASVNSLLATFELQLSVYEYKHHKLYASIENVFHITQLERRLLCQMQKQSQTWNSKAMPYQAELTLKPETPYNLVCPLIQHDGSHEAAEMLLSCMHQGWRHKAWCTHRKNGCSCLQGRQEKLVQLALEEYVGDQSSCLLGRGRICWGSEQLLTGKRKNSLCSWPLRKKLGRCLMALVLRAVMLLNLPGCSLRRADTLSIT